jgi:hypothetical protein
VDFNNHVGPVAPDPGALWGFGCDDWARSTSHFLRRGCTMRRNTLVSLVTVTILVLVAIASGPARSAADAAVDAVVEMGASSPGGPVFQMSKTLDGTTLQCTGNAGDCGSTKL